MTDKKDEDSKRASGESKNEADNITVKQTLKCKVLPFPVAEAVAPIVISAHTNWTPPPLPRAQTPLKKDTPFSPPPLPSVSQNKKAENPTNARTNRKNDSKRKRISPWMIIGFLLFGAAKFIEANKEPGYYDPLNNIHLPPRNSSKQNPMKIDPKQSKRILEKLNDQKKNNQQKDEEFK